MLTKKLKKLQSSLKEIIKKSSGAKSFGQFIDLLKGPLMEGLCVRLINEICTSANVANAEVIANL